MKNYKGITLIALIITIIVMLILAAVTINMVIGEDGVIARAEEAKVEQEKATEKDKIQLAMADAKIAGLKELTWDNFENSLKKEFGDIAEIVTERKDYFWVKVGENEYTVYKAGKVENEYKLIIEKHSVVDGKFTAIFDKEKKEATEVILKSPEKDFKGTVEFPDYIEKDGIKYKVVDLGKHDGYNFSEVTLPDSIVDYDLGVTGDFVFRNCLSLKKINISKNMKKVPQGFVIGCENIEEIVIAKGVEEIGESAFKGCKNLKKLILPEGVKIIGNEAFCKCINLEIELPSTIEIIEILPVFGYNETEYVSKIKFNKTPEEIKKFSNLKIYIDVGIVYDINEDLVTF